MVLVPTLDENFSRKNSNKILVAAFSKQISTKFSKKIDTSGGTIFEGNFCHYISFDILVEICLENAVTKVPLKNSTQASQFPLTF